MLRIILRWAVGGLTVLHGLVHLMGAAKGLGWSPMPQLTEPIGPVLGLTWLAAAAVVTCAGLAVIRRVRWWWLPAGAGAALSQAVIVSSWADAWAGTAGNVVLLAAAVYGAAAHGPWGLPAAYQAAAQRMVADSVGTHADTGPVTREDTEWLPEPVARYVRAAGAVGRPRLRGFRARIRGRIRGGPQQPWMPFVGEQTNTFGETPGRALLLDATMRGLPTDVLHVFAGPHASMRARFVSLLRVLDARGADLDQAETVTLLNDLCVLAPAALVDAPIAWTSIDDQHAAASLTRCGHTARALLFFDDRYRLVDFVSEDRLRVGSDGRSFTRQRWSTPVGAYRGFGGRQVSSSGRGRWHPPDDEAFDYLEFHLDDITYLEAASTPTGAPWQPASDPWELRAL